jgi:hypothetical protein
MKGWGAVAVAGVLLSGGAFVLSLEDCAGGRPNGLQSVLGDLIGEPASAATGRLGRADTIRPQASGTTYVWIAHGPAAQASGGAKHNGAGAQLAAAIKANPDAVHPHQPCTLIMTTDVTERIKTFRVAGDQTHCESFDRAMGGKASP